MYWLTLQWYSSEGFEGSIKPSQPSDIKNSLYWPNPGGGGVLPYMGYIGYVPLWRIWFSSGLLWDRVYKSESLGLE